NVQHDTTVAIATENGLIGAILYTSFFVVLFRSLLRLRKYSRSSEKRDFYATCIAAIAILIINGMFADFRFWMPQNGLVFFIAGLGLGIRPDEERVRAPLIVSGNARWRAECGIIGTNPQSPVTAGRQG